MNRREANEIIEKYKEIIPTGKVIIEIRADSTFESTTVIEEIFLARLSDVQNKPERDETIAIMTIKTSDEVLHFVLQDLSVTKILHGARLFIGDITVDIRSTV